MTGQNDIHNTFHEICGQPRDDVGQPNFSYRLPIMQPLQFYICVPLLYCIKKNNNKKYKRVCVNSW